MEGKRIQRMHDRMVSFSPRTKLLFLSLAVGVCSGSAAVLLSWIIEVLKGWVDKGVTGGINYLYLVLPGVGMLLSLVFLMYVVRDNIGHGVTKVLVAVSKNESRIKPHNMFSSLLTSAVTIGLGGSVGAEAPIVYTGAAIGSNFARYMGLSYKNMTILLGCGAAGAIAGIFKAPLAGVLFTMEILLFNISMSSMLPLLMSTVSATVVAYIFRGQSFPFACTLTDFSMGNIPFYIILGVLVGLGSLYFIRFTIFLEDKLGKLRHPYLKWIICSASLGVILFFFPNLYGEGYTTLTDLLNVGTSWQPAELLPGMLSASAWGIVAFFVLTFFLKVIAMTLTNAGGGVGGTFGPTLFEGGILGFIVARSMNLLLSDAGICVPEANFVLVGMAAMMAGVMQAPMTAIFLIAEISGGYSLLLPLILGATVSFGTVRIFERYSIYTKRIAASGELLTHDNDQALMTLLKTGDLVRDKYPRVLPSDTLRHVVSVISSSSAAVLAVVDESGKYCGIINVDENRNLFFKEEMYDNMFVSGFMAEAPAIVHEEEPMSLVMRKFDETEAWRLPVISADGSYKGFISRSRILTAYREELKVISQD